MRNRARPNRKTTRNPDSSRFSSVHAEAKQSSLHKNIADYEEFVTTILPAFRKDVKSGMSAEELQKKYAALAAARMITIALTDTNASTASAASKDILDRAGGKATEKKEITHKFKDLSDAELDAVLASEEDDLKEMQERFEQ